MLERDKPHTPPPGPDGDGVRVIAKARTARRSALPWVLAVIVVLGAVVAWSVMKSRPSGHSAADVDVSSSGSDKRAASRPNQPASLPGETPDVLPNGDPNDLANYFRPGDPEPTGAELIGAMHEVGMRTGIGAFNPPGTSPPLEGLAVPEDFALPKGYVRHYQSTDAGVAIEPILMFAPDFTLYDVNGRLVPMPLDRVVPPALAPPGLPLRRVRIPPPRP